MIFLWFSFYVFGLSCLICYILGEIRLLLVDFMMETQSRVSSIRKITPVSTETPTKEQVSHKQLQVNK